MAPNPTFVESSRFLTPTAKFCPPVPVHTGIPAYTCKLNCLILIIDFITFCLNIHAKCEKVRDLIMNGSAGILSLLLIAMVINKRKGVLN